MPKIIEKKLIDEFKDRESFTREELFEFYRCFEPDLKDGTFGWRVYDLKVKNIIRTLTKGRYAISCKPQYRPEISPELVKLAKRITGKFEDARHCIWVTEWLNEFTSHQISRKTMLIEIEKDFMESLYYELKDASISELFLNPDDKTINFYIAESNFPVVIKNLITRSPVSRRTEKKVKFYTPLLEKILVDIFVEKNLFYYLQGSDMINIYENAVSNYSINFTKLFSYAKRRGIDHDIRQFMMSHINYLIKDIFE
jgi:hypothetical protein